MSTHSSLLSAGGRCDLQRVHRESDVYALLAVLLRHGQVLGIYAGVHHVVVPIAIALQLIGSRYRSDASGS
jgi:hypothetical protein